MTPTTHTLSVPGARLHYEVRGSGPFLAVIGSPMAAGEFAPLADALADTYTVITYDPRGMAGSPLDDPDEASSAELRADDVIAILDAVGADTADVFGSSGGAVTGLAMVECHPGRVRMLVAHEPPLLELLPDADEQRAKTDDIIATFHTHGVGAAWAKFMINAGFSLDEGGPPPNDEPTLQEQAMSARFFDHDLRATTRFAPNVDALKAARVIVGLGADSTHLATYRTSTALADLLGPPAVELPGDHGGFLTHTDEFAKRLVEVLD